MKEIISNEGLKKIYEKGQSFVYNDYTPYSNMENNLTSQIKTG